MQKQKAYENKTTAKIQGVRNWKIKKGKENPLPIECCDSKMHNRKMAKLMTKNRKLKSEIVFSNSKVKV